MAGAISVPKTTFVKPQLAADEMYGGSLNLFAPTVEADSKNGGSLDDDTSNSSSSSDTSSSGGSSGSVKVVKL